jgi:hypothetical protein
MLAGSLIVFVAGTCLSKSARPPIVRKPVVSSIAVMLFHGAKTEALAMGLA